MMKKNFSYTQDNYFYKIWWIEFFKISKQNLDHVFNSNDILHTPQNKVFNKHFSSRFWILKRKRNTTSVHF